MTTCSFKISPSLLAFSDWVRFESLLFFLENCNIDSLHIDVMDGHFVPNLAFGPALVKSIKEHTKHPLDLHLMISCLDSLLPIYIALKPRTIFFHPEVCTDILPHIEKIKEAGIRVGFSINPDRDLTTVRQFLDAIDSLLIMTVYPGFSGQMMIKELLEKTLQAKSIGFKGELWIDGGVDFSKMTLLQQYPIDGVIMGKGYFSQLDLK